MAGRTFELIAYHVAGSALNQASVTHGKLDAVTPANNTIKTEFITPAGITLLRSTYYGLPRPHRGGTPRFTMSVAGVIRIPDGTRIAIKVQRKAGHNDPFTVLVAEGNGNNLKAGMKELGRPKGQDNRKATAAKLRKGKRNGETFYVWTRGHFRFTIKKP
jgi:hypothetical protein